MLIIGQAKITTTHQSTDLWSSHISYQPLREPSQCIIKSTNDADKAEGTGCNVVQVTGLTAWNQPESSELVELSGIRPASTQSEFLVINSVRCLAFGEANRNIGTINITALADGRPMAAVLPSVGRDTDAVYAVPAGRTLTINAASCQVMQSTPAYKADVSLLVMANADTASAGWQLLTWCNTNTTAEVTGPAVIKACCDYVNQPFANVSVAISGDLSNANEG